MPWIDFWRRTARPAQPKAPATADGDVNDELMFHFRALLNEKLAAGLTFDAAWEEAERQFGPMRRYENECHALQLEKRLNGRMAGGLAMVLLLPLVGWFAFEVPAGRLNNEVHLLRQDLQALRQEQNQRLARFRVDGDGGDPAEAVDLTGVVHGEDNRPLADATVLVILKTWPGGVYQQEAFTAKTGKEGGFKLPGLIPAANRYAILVAALKEGFAFKSVYQLKETKPIEKPDAITLRLERASQVTLVVRDGSGRPIPNAHVTPSARNSLLGESHLIYFQGSEPAHRMTDAEGRVSLDCFLTGDRAEVYLRLPGDDWGSREFDVADDNSVIEVAAATANEE
jgi:hypothetical protein